MGLGRKNSLSSSLISLFSKTLGREAREKRRRKRQGLAYATIVPTFEELEFGTAQERVRAELEHELSVAFNTYAKVRGRASHSLDSISSARVRWAMAAFQA